MWCVNLHPYSNVSLIDSLYRDIYVWGCSLRAVADLCSILSTLEGEVISTSTLTLVMCVVWVSHACWLELRSSKSGYSYLHTYLWPTSVHFLVSKFLMSAANTLDDLHGTTIRDEIILWKNHSHITWSKIKWKPKSHRGQIVFLFLESL